ncbi:putative 2-aminoethylphosphonate ABC transporter substrate-binding protein [Rhodobacteraceae bacterium 2376]|uniref:Putative 2-aminoethylphosphonate ABC transporter substrate-binding protein n=1 Tax=Rhabdonatronobacter sediminivivens TaxID=2743469 RepID=A0A7Z0HZB7_9RHOB|nr:putative 2-aminoethylphosphonate ABC transporter substrate-binding protein [Rhabdonatronobacter sediminivivens]NYS25066.1 putative 2-aminoethylphosphonate ABC transporter substrate-binding protein [Rhabdonatronobacter sediminivivens]
MKTGLKLGVAIGALALAATAGQVDARTALTVYTALENDQLGPFKAAIEEAVPDVEVVWVRDSTGVITARFLAEADNPQADIVLGLAVSSLMMFDEAGLLASYAPAGADELKPQFADRRDEPTWLGMDAYVGVICYNTAMGEAMGLETPTSWADLLAPEFEGQIVMPHPASSGTGYLTVAAWLQLMGEDDGWDFMDGLHQNIAGYLHSGSAPCVQAARGERLVGIALDMRGVQEQAMGAPLEVVIPSEGVGWEMEAAAIVEGTDHMDLAQQVMDWAASREANDLYQETYAIVAHPDADNYPDGYPAGVEEALIDNDFGWMAANRDRVLEEWASRYEAKAAPRD